MTGSASVVRNGVTVTLNDGDTVCRTTSCRPAAAPALGLVMIDGTTFNLSAGARLMLNDLTYDANSTSNSSLFTLVQGAASFVAGQVAKTGDMKVGTPVATMGIRGTAVILDISAVDGKVSISVDRSARRSGPFGSGLQHQGDLDRNGDQQRLDADADADRQFRGDRPGERQDRRASRGRNSMRSGRRCRPTDAGKALDSGPAAAHRHQSESEYADEICQQSHAGLAQHGVPSPTVFPPAPVRAKARDAVCSCRTRRRSLPTGRAPSDGDRQARGRSWSRSSFRPRRCRSSSIRPPCRRFLPAPATISAR